MSSKFHYVNCSESSIYWSRLLPVVSFKKYEEYVEAKENKKNTIKGPEKEMPYANFKRKGRITLPILQTVLWKPTPIALI